MPQCPIAGDAHGAVAIAKVAMKTTNDTRLSYDDLTG